MQRRFPRTDEGYHTMKSSHVFARLAAMFATARRRARERSELALLDDRDLRDAGLSRAALAFELNKPLWRG